MSVCKARFSVISLTILVSVASVLVSGASCQFPHSYAAARALMEPVIIMMVTELKSLKALQARMELLSSSYDALIKLL